MSSSLLAQARRRDRPIDDLFPAQRAAVDDPHNRVCLWTSGRAGKSTAVLTKFVQDGLDHPNSVYWYFSLTGPHVEEIAWPTLRRLDALYGLGCRFQEDKLRVILPGGSWIRCFGFDRPLALDRFYGVRLRGAAIDEAAFSNLDLDEFAEDTLGPRLLDQGGTLYLMSIPGRVPRGLFDEIIAGFPKRVNMSGVRSPTRRRWSVHSWTWADNPAMREVVAAELARIKADEPELLKRPSTRRNYFGERVTDRQGRVYDFLRDRNTYWRADPKTGLLVSSWLMQPDDHYVLGLDFGWDDCAAFSFNAWRDDGPDLVELESYRETEMRMRAIADRVRMYQEWAGGEERLDIVADPSHKDYFEEIRRRYDLPIKVAEKASKYDWIEVENDDLSLGHVLIVDPESSPHVHEMQHLTRKVLKTGKWVEQPGKPNDCCDAHLVAYRESYHYLHKEEPPVPEPGSREALEAEEQRMVDELEAADRERDWR